MLRVQLRSKAKVNGFWKRMSSTIAEEDDVLFHIKNQARVITLNRPAKYNALNTSMVEKITPRLIEYSKSLLANLVILNSNCKPSFCSGGDVVECAKQNIAGKEYNSIDFFNKEYNLNYLLSTYNKPIVAMLNGITMGGGAGLSIHNPFRVACEETKFAMPEAHIGFFTDVGMSFYMNKLDYNLGYYLLLTGEILQGLDLFVAGVATHYVPSRKFDELTARLSLIDYNFEEKDSDIKEIYEQINETLEEFQEPIPKNYKFKYSVEDLTVIERCFNPEFTIEQVFKLLTEDGSPFAQQTLEQLRSKSPVSLHLIMEILKRSRSTNIQEALRNELILASNMMFKPQLNDFNECITKRLINKKATNPEDKVPVYKYSSVSEIPVSLINEELLSPSKEMTQIVDVGSLSPSEKLASSDTVVGGSPTLTALANLKMENFFNYTFNEYPHHYSLPTANDLKLYITGNDNSNRSYAVKRDEVLKYFNRKTNGKLGVEYKVDLILKKNTRPSKFDDLYLDWVD